MAGLLDISPELLKQILSNTQIGGEKGLLYGSTGGYIPVDNNSYLQFGLSGNQSKYDSGISRANAEYNQGNNAFGVSYDKYYNAGMPNVDLPEAIRNKLQYYNPSPMGDLLNLYYKRQF